MTKHCSVPGCDKTGKIVHGLCRMHETRLRRHGDVNTVKRQDGKGTNNPHWRGNDIAYRTAHDRVVRQRGKASQYRCADCGKPAKSWSYNLTDPQELSGPGRGNGSIQRWSVDPAHYEPRCHSCHLTFGHSARRRAG